MIKDFYKTIKLKKLKNGQFSFFYILQLPHTVISNSENMTHPNMYVLYLTLSSTDNCLWSVVYKSGGYITERYICVLILTLSSTDSYLWSVIYRKEREMYKRDICVCAVLNPIIYWKLLMICCTVYRSGGYKLYNRDIYVCAVLNPIIHR